MSRKIRTSPRRRRHWRKTWAGACARSAGPQASSSSLTVIISMIAGNNCNVCRYVTRHTSNKPLNCWRRIKSIFSACFQLLIDTDIFIALTLCLTGSDTSENPFLYGESGNGRWIKGEKLSQLFAILEANFTYLTQVNLKLRGLK